MGIKRVINTDFWNDSKVVELFSPEDRYFFLYLLTNPHTTQLGVYPLPVKTMAFETGYSSETIRVLLDRFENKYGLIRRNEETNETAIRNYLRHSIVKGGKPVFDLLEREAQRVKDRELLTYVCNAAKSSDNNTVRAFVTQYISNTDKVINVSSKKYITSITNNDNDDSYHESYHESLKTTKNRQKREIQRHKYGEYRNVILSDSEMEKLKSEFPNDWEQRIERLDSYIESKGASYKNHLATIRNWARKDKEQNAKIGGYSSGISETGIQYGNNY